MSEAEQTSPPVDGFPGTRNVRILGGPDTVAEPAGSASAALATMVGARHHEGGT